MRTTIMGLAIAATLAIAAGILSLVVMVRNYWKFRGDSVVNCPETRKPAGVRVNALRAAVDSLRGRSGKVRLEQCSRWPEREQCGQECLNQIRHDANLCHVSAMAEQWYAGRDCTLCGKPIGKLSWHDHPPAMADEKRHTVQWNEIQPEDLQKALETHLPICWSCHMAETFRRRFPERVVDRPWKRGAMGEYIGEDEAPVSITASDEAESSGSAANEGSKSQAT